jgi:holo-[acyl-carrier protein] synthase
MQSTIFNIGIDIEEVERFSNMPYEQKKSFYEKIFSCDEIKYCLSKADPYPHFTVRFCAKEATIKALDTKKLNLSEIEVEIKGSKPILKLPFPHTASISLSHTKKFATAFVLFPK